MGFDVLSEPVAQLAWIHAYQTQNATHALIPENKTCWLLHGFSCEVVFIWHILPCKAFTKNLQVVRERLQAGMAAQKECNQNRSAGLQSRWKQNKSKQNPLKIKVAFSSPICDFTNWSGSCPTSSLSSFCGLLSFWISGKISSQYAWNPYIEWHAAKRGSSLQSSPQVLFPSQCHRWWFRDEHQRALGQYPLGEYCSAATSPGEWWNYMPFSTPLKYSWVLASECCRKGVQVLEWFTMHSANLWTFRVF